MRKLVLTVVLATGIVSGCGSLEDLVAVGRFCSEPPGEVAGAEQRDPLGPGEAFEGRDVSQMTIAEVDQVARDAGVAMTWRWSYGIGTDPNTGYAECWCVAPPSGRVTDIMVDSGGRLIVFVDSGERRPAARPQPRSGWGCPEAA